MKKFILVLCLAVILPLSFTHLSSAENQNSDLSPKTQQYIDNLNEVQQAQDAGSPASSQAASSGPSFWTFVLYGFLSGAAWAFWRWLKKLKNGD